MFREIRLRNGDSNSENIVHNPNACPVFQRGMAIIDKDSPIKEIGTFGLGPCIALSLYSRDKKVLVVCHFDGMTKVFDSFLDILSLLREANLSDTDIDNLEDTIIGGDHTTAKLKDDIQKAIIDTSFGKIKEEVVSQDGSSLRFVVNVGDGNIRMNEIPTKSENPEVRNRKLSRIDSNERSPLELEYKSLNGLSMDFT